MSDRKPKVGEVWTFLARTWECLKDIDGTNYLWWVTGDEGSSVVTDDAEHLTPPTTPPPAWLDDDCWVSFVGGDDDGYDMELVDSVGERAGHFPAFVRAICRLDPSTFEWLDGR